MYKKAGGFPNALIADQLKLLEEYKTDGLPKEARKSSSPDYEAEGDAQAARCEEETPPPTVVAAVWPNKLAVEVEWGKGRVF